MGSFILCRSDLSWNKYVNKGPSSCIISHFHFLLHCDCNMKQPWEGKMSKALTVRATGFSWILVQNSGSYQAAYGRWPLPLSTSYWFQQYCSWDYHYAIRKYQKVGKSQIQVSERSRAQFVLWAAWELSAYIPRSSPSCWNKQEFLAQQVMPGQASQRRGLSEHWEPCEGSTNVIWRRYKHCVCNVLEQPWRHLPRAC